MEKVKHLEDNLEYLKQELTDDEITILPFSPDRCDWLSDSKAKECLQIIESTPECDIFNDHLQYLCGGGSRCSYFELLAWLIRRTKVVGGKEAILNLEEYLKSDSFTVKHYLLLTDIEPEQDFKFSNGINFIKVANVPEEDFKNKLLKRLNSDAFLSQNVWSLLGFESTHPKIHIPISSLKLGLQSYSDSWIESLELTRLLINLALENHIGVFPLAASTIVVDKVPYLRFPIWRILNSKPSSYVKVNMNELSHADELVTKFDKLSPALQAKILICLIKLNNFGAFESFGEKAINIRTCLESLFMGDGNQEQLSYRVSLRAALFLGETLEERKDIFDTVRKCYSMASQAIHNGKFARRTDFNDVIKTANYLKKGIIKMICLNTPLDWTNIELNCGIVSNK